MIQENLTAYLFLAPAGTIIFLFGLFPVAFAFFVSLHKWRRFPEEYEGLDSYVEAVGNMAFVAFFWLALGALVFAGYTAWRLWRATRDERLGLIQILPAIVVTAAIFAWVDWFFRLLPVIMSIPQRILGQQVTQQIFVEEFLASFRYENVLDAANLMLPLILVAGLVVAFFQTRVESENNIQYLILAVTMLVALIAGVLLMQLTLDEIDIAIEEAREDGETLGVWVQIILISAGAGLIFAALWLWQQTVNAYSNREFILKGLATIALVIGGYFLITQLPRALAEADEDVMQGFGVTVMYSVFSVPLQLTFGLGLAVLLFQNIKGKSFFRVVYFLPYITPFVATSTVFALLFSHRSGSPANQLLTGLGLDEQAWLLEPDGIFKIMFGEGVPDALAGPGLALLVIIIYSIWTFAGYSTVIFLAGLGNIPNELYEAAKIDGANNWQSFRNITLPLLSPTTFFLILISTIGTFQAFTQIFLMRRPGAYEAVDTINIFIYEEVRDARPDFAYGSAMAFVLFGVILTLTLIQNRIVGRRVFYG